MPCGVFARAIVRVSEDRPRHHDFSSARTSIAKPPEQLLQRLSTLDASFASKNLHADFAVFTEFDFPPLTWHRYLDHKRTFSRVGQSVVDMCGS